MNDNEKQGCRDLLSMLDWKELLALSDTVTCKKVTVQRKTEAIKAIVSYSESAQQLLRRQKMKRDILFKYLNDNAVTVFPNMEKKKLIMATLNYWGSKIDLEEMEVEDFDENSWDSSSSSSQTGGSQDHHHQQLQHCTHSNPASPIIIINNTQTNYFDTTNNYYPANPTSTADNRSQSQHPGQAQTVPGSTVVPSHTKVTNQSSGDTSLTKSVSSELRTLSEMFVKWYFENLNSHNPTLNKAPGDYGPHHFWDDAILVLRLHSTDTSEHLIKGPDQVSHRLLTFTKEDQLLYNANISEEGLQIKSDPHGLVLILVCGTVHRGSECLGVFQQLFGIIKDPRYDNNWKIKQVKLEMRTTKVTSMPKLEGNVDDQLTALVAV